MFRKTFTTPAASPILPLFFWMYCTVASSQNLQVTNAQTAPFTPQNLISNIFLGDGVEVTNITFKGKAVSVGYFTGGLQAVGLERGIVMTTGLVETNKTQTNWYGCQEKGSVGASNNVSGMAIPTDPDLSKLATNALYDLTSYTITFIPTADTLRFRYCFASEEYPEYACSDYNDIFGFFIQGPGYPTPTNIAKIPGTNLPVAINNLHPDNSKPNEPCLPKYIQYYVNNNNSNKQPTYDGLTHVFTAEAIVVPCQTYTIKLAISDVSDPVLDSGVFLEAKSFGTGSLRTQVATPGPDGTITEGCSPGSITFRLPSPAEHDFPIDFTVLGTAANGIDYQNIPSNLVIPAGQSEVSVPIIAFEDNNTESSEYIALDVRRDPCNRDTLLIFLRDNTIKAPHLLADTTLCTGAPAVQLNATLPIQLPPPPSFSNTNPVAIGPVGSPVFSPVNVFGVLPGSLQPGMIRSVCLNIKHGWVDDIDAFLIAPGGQFIELMTDCGANGLDFTNTCFTPTANNKIGQASALAAPFSGDWLPEGPWSDVWGGGAYPANGQWRLQLIDDQNGIDGILEDWAITFEPSYEVNYQWTPTTGLSCPTCPVAEASPATTTTYNVRATDSYGCFVEDSVHVDVVQLLAAPGVSCGGYTNNSITFTWNSVPGAAGYEVNVGGSGWVPASGLNSHLVDGLSPDAAINIEVRATGSSSAFCTALAGSATCSNCQQPVVSATTKAVSCFAGGDGSVNLSTNNLNPPYTFQIDTKSNTNGLFTGLQAGNYEATVTDNTGCATFFPVTVGSALNLDITIIPKNVTCFGGDDGGATAAVTGGTSPYTYIWSDPANQTGSSAVNLKAGTYTVTVTDMAGCAGTASITLTQPTDLIVSVMASLAKCHGDSSGSATVSASGGAGPYQFAWSNGQTGQIATNLKAGTYTVTVTDVIGCAKTSFALIGQPLKLTATISSTLTTCSNLNDGTVTVNTQGGSGGLTYSWSDPAGQKTAAAANLSAGIYTVTITDKNNCTLTMTDTVVAPPPIQATLTGTDVLCFGTATGSASVQATGGTGNLTYIWSDPAGQKTSTATNLPAGAYTVTVSDANGCSSAGSITLQQPEALLLSTTVVPIACFGNATGSINTQVQGGTAPLAYKWSSSETTPGIANKPAGTYSVTVTDQEGCSAAATATLTQPPQLNFSATQANIPCFGEKTGSIQLDINGGTGSYAVIWTGSGGYTGNGAAINNLSAGAYSATITDGAGCSGTQQVTITQPAAALTLTLPTLADTICFGATNGAATVQVAGGTTPYAYLWDAGNQNTATATGLSSALYHVTVTDANNCTAVDSTFIFQKEQLNAWADGGTVDCFGSSDGTAQVTAVFYGATPANLSSFTYLWSTIPSQTGVQATNLIAGNTYTVTVTDALGCSATQTASITNVAQVTASIISTTDPTCYNGADGKIIASGKGGVAPYTYQWSSNVVSTTDSLAQNLPSDTYYVTAVDAKGCTGTASASLGQPAALQINFQTTDVLCYGESNGRAKAIPGGGNAPYQLQWSNGSQANEVQNLPAGMYQVTVSDRNGCTFSKTVDIGQPDTPLAGTLEKKDVVCAGGYTGQLLIAGSGGTPPYRYSLDGINWNGSSKQIGLPAGVYTPWIQDQTGCSAQLAPVEITQRPAVELELGPSITIQLGESAQLLAEVLNGADPLAYFWNPADSLLLSCLDCPDPVVDSLLSEHFFELLVTDSLGCTARDKVLVIVEKQRKVFVPTAFSPNGDGANDLLLVHGQQNTRVLSFQVFDRWGELLYQGFDFTLNAPTIGWDGSFRDQPANPGVYVWVLEVEYVDGVREVFKGNTTLIR